ncbi:hypothetical protein SHKM778_16760 [Streptomyces sp. KM77-8]
MKFRSALVTAVGMVAVSILSATPASAAPGWQYLGGSDFYPDKTGAGCHTNRFSSGGGWIKLTYYRPGYPYTSTKIRVYEYDPDNADDFVHEMMIYDWTTAEVYVDDFVDGDNKKAEIYFRGPCEGAPSVHVYD